MLGVLLAHLRHLFCGMQEGRGGSDLEGGGGVPVYDAASVFRKEKSRVLATVCDEIEIEAARLRV